MEYGWTVVEFNRHTLLQIKGLADAAMDETKERARQGPNVGSASAAWYEAQGKPIPASLRRKGFR